MASQTHFVRAVFDLHCVWNGVQRPAYRIYVNDQMFTERTWLANDDQFQITHLQLDVPTGKYNVHVKSCDPEAAFHVNNGRIEQGPAKMVKNSRITVADWLEPV